MDEVAWTALIVMPLGLTIPSSTQLAGRQQLRLILRSVLTLGSFRLGGLPAPIEQPLPYN